MKYAKNDLPVIQDCLNGWSRQSWARVDNNYVLLVLSQLSSVQLCPGLAQFLNDLGLRVVEWLGSARELC